VSLGRKVRESLTVFGEVFFASRSERHGRESVGAVTQKESKSAAVSLSSTCRQMRGGMGSLPGDRRCLARVHSEGRQPKSLLANTVVSAVGPTSSLEMMPDATREAELRAVDIASHPTRIGLLHAGAPAAISGATW
jgi:hypothetical protein